MTTKGRLYLVDMDARDVNKEIDLVAMSTSPACAKIENEKIFSVLVGGVTYHIKDETGFKVQNWVTEINTVVRELSL